MFKYYYVNNNATHNPGNHHEVHTQEHAEQLKIRDKLYLGFFSDEISAVKEAKKHYPDADGCGICCPKARHG